MERVLVFFRVKRRVYFYRSLKPKTNSKSIPDEISGIILYPETVLEFHLAGFVAERGIIPGVRANGELSPLPSSPKEFIVQGLDGLLPRLQAARAAGVRFSKWRVPIACTSRSSPGGGLPTEAALE